MTSVLRRWGHAWKKGRTVCGAKKCARSASGAGGRLSNLGSRVSQRRRRGKGTHADDARARRGERRVHRRRRRAVGRALAAARGRRRGERRHDVLLVTRGGLLEVKSEQPRGGGGGRGGGSELVLVLALQPAEDGVEGVERCARGGAGGGDVHRKSAWRGKERLVKGKEKEERRASKGYIVAPCMPLLQPRRGSCMHEMKLQKKLNGA